jgi:hypothetical protein
VIGELGNVDRLDVAMNIPAPARKPIYNLKSKIINVLNPTDHLRQVRI